MNVQSNTYKCVTVFALTIIAVLVLGCSDQSVQYSYETWVESEENGLRKSKPVGNYQYSIQYRPWSYIAKRELRDESYDETKMKKKIHEMDELQYFSLRIALRKDEGDVLRSGLYGEGEYEERIAYLNGHINKDIFLLDGGDTLSCVLHHFERNFGIAPYLNVSLGFEITADEKEAILNEVPFAYSDKSLVFEDKLFGTGMVRLTIRGEDLANIPVKLSDI
ncbi:MAG: hypothetical protein JKY52_20795 [Flavobacteriales bacterium]|nr:hypothetical protein [Flavobacteriales bacterium]